MNLIKRFNKKIAEMEISIHDKHIFYTDTVGIRCEIGGEEYVYIKKGIMRKPHPNPHYVNPAVERALAIFHALQEKDWIVRIDLYDKKEIKETIKRLQFVEPEEKVLNEFEADREKITHYELYWSLNDIDRSVETVIREVILADIGGLSCLASAVYLLSPDEKILFYLYDDRGLDVVSKYKRKLYPLYETFNDWILEYDRESIDKIFKRKQATFELGNLLDFLNKLEESNIYYQLNQFHNSSF